MYLHSWGNYYYYYFPFGSAGSPFSCHITTASHSPKCIILCIRITWELLKRLRVASMKDSLSSKHNLIETRTNITVGAMPLNIWLRVMANSRVLIIVLGSDHDCTGSLRKPVTTQKECHTGFDYYE